MFSSYLQISVVFIILSSVQLAPVDEKKSLFDIVDNDKRAELLKTRKFVKNECVKSESLCIALYDISLRFNELKLNFSQNKITLNDKICNKLIEVLPDKSNFDEATLDNIQKNSNNVSWIKDIFKKDSKRCHDDCTFESIEEDYEVKVKPVCLFIYNQYNFLASQSTTVKQETIASKSGEETKSSENNAKPETKPVTEVSQKLPAEVASAFVPILPANAVAESPKAQNEPQQQQIQAPAQQQPQPEQQPSLKSPEVVKETAKKEEKPVTSAPTVIANKSETAQAKAETPKTDSTVNTVDLEQENLENSPDEKDIFDTQSDLPEKDIDANDPNLDIDPDDDDPDADYSPDLNIRDNNRNAQNNKFNNLPLTDVEPHDSDQSRVRVEKVLDEFEDNPDSNFFTYLCIVMFLSILFYILYHNRHKILALVLEGRRGSRRPRERSRGGSKAAYSKLDCNLEEAITSKKSLSGKSMDIIY